MRIRATGLVVAGLLVVLGLAAADALRGKGSPEDEKATSAAATRGATTQGETEAPEPPTAAEELADLGIGGLLYASVRRGLGCRLDVVALPTLSRSSLFELESCRIRVSATGVVVAIRTCSDTGVRAFTAPSRGGVRRFRGCAPAWRPDGGLTFVNRGGDVVELVEPCGSRQLCISVVVSRREVPKRIVDLAWLSHDRLAALVRGRHPVARWFAVFRGGRRVSYEEIGFAVGDRIAAVGARLLVPAGDAPAPVLGFDSSGRFGAREALASYLADGRAFAASSDGRWIASTLGDSVQIYPAAVPLPLDAVALDLRAVDLAWVGG